MGLKEAQYHLCTLQNITCIKTIKSVGSDVLLHTIFICGILLATFGNLTVIISISHFKQLHTPTNVLTLSLAVADFLIGLCDMPVFMVRAVDECWYINETVCMAGIFYHATLTTASVTHLIFLAIDRYCAVCYPLVYTTMVTIQAACLFSAVSWLYSILYTILMYHYTFETLYSSDEHCIGDCLIAAYYTIQTVDFVLAYVLPFAVIVTVYSKIFIVAAKHARAIHVTKKEGKFLRHNRNKESQRSQHKASITIAFLVCTFLACVSPVYLCQFIEGYTSISTSVRNVLQYLYLFNFAFNPIIYGLFYPWFRKAFKIIVKCKIFKRDSSLTDLFSKKH